MPDKDWSVYMVKTSKNNLYTGISKNVERRVKQHNEGKGAKSLLGQRPVELVWHIGGFDKSSALKLEYKIKSLSRENKEKFIEGNLILEAD